MKPQERKRHSRNRSLTVLVPSFTFLHGASGGRVTLLSPTCAKPREAPTPKPLRLFLIGWPQV